MLVADISNYGGELTPDEIEGLRAAGVQHVIVRLSLEDEARAAITLQQIGACKAGGMPHSGYAFPDYEADPGGHMLRLFGAFGCMRSLWIDVEPPGLPGFQAIEDWVRAAKAACPPDLPFGVYTAAWVAALFTDWGDLSDLPLWCARYDATRAQDLTVAFGGWTRAAGLQYVGTVDVAGQSCDLSWFEAGALG